MRLVGVIPARMGSSRFPGKPLASLHGRPMLEHVYRRTAACEMLHEVFVATCDDEIAVAAAQFGARAVMTSRAHERATDRVAEATANDSADIVVMVQGDEPMIHPAMVAAAVEPLLEEPSLNCVNLAALIGSENEARDPNTIKVATALNGDALYFSRSVIPTMAGERFRNGGWIKQVCIIAFRRQSLRRFSSLPQGPLERIESIDMLRFLENGVPVRMVMTEHETHAVDTPADLELVARLLAADSYSFGAG